MAEDAKKTDQEQKQLGNVEPEKKEIKVENKESKSPPDVAPIEPGAQQQSPPPGTLGPTSPGTSEPPPGPLTPQEMKQNAEDEDRKTMRVIQVIQHMNNQRIEIHPVQNIKVRSDMVGMLTQGLNNIQNEDMMRNNAALLKEAVTMIKGEKKQQ